MIQNTMNPSLELLENVLFSIVLNHNPLGSGNVVNSYEIVFEKNCFINGLCSQVKQDVIICLGNRKILPSGQINSFML